MDRNFAAVCAGCILRNDLRILPVALMSLIHKTANISKTCANRVYGTVCLEAVQQGGDRYPMAFVMCV
jgi:hypothetical protein